MFGRDRSTEAVFIRTQAETILSGPDAADISADWREVDCVDVAAWQTLQDRALEPNPFYGPVMVRAAARCLPEGRRLRLLVAHRGADLVGLFPLVEDRGRYVLPMPLLRAAEVIGPLSTPLLDPVAPERVWSAMLGRIAAGGIRGVLLPYMIGDGPVLRALEAARRARGYGVAPLGTHERAMLTSDLVGADYVRATLQPHRRKEVARQRRRLAEQGELDLRVARTPSEIGPALDAFLDLEASGWKGRRGTGLKQSEGVADFMREAAHGLAERDAIRIVALASGNTIVASGIVLTSQTRAYYFKTAYDETFARYSPGLLLTLDLTRLLLDDPTIEDADSVAVAGHTMIEPVWSGRQPMHRLLVAPGPRAAGVFRVMAALERLRERLRLSTATLRAGSRARFYLPFRR